jgi:hypothetical protein
LDLPEEGPNGDKIRDPTAQYSQRTEPRKPITKRNEAQKVNPEAGEYPAPPESRPIAGESRSLEMRHAVRYGSFLFRTDETFRKYSPLRNIASWSFAHWSRCSPDGDLDSAVSDPVWLAAADEVGIRSATP